MVSMIRVQRAGPSFTVSIIDIRISKFTDEFLYAHPRFEVVIRFKGPICSVAVVSIESRGAFDLNFSALT